MKFLYICFSLLSFSCLHQTSSSQDLPAFPGAEGFGSTTPGGRGGKVILVTNLNADGPGSFRNACETSGPRIVIFLTGGTIQISREIKIPHPYITVAGQTAPGDGICIKGAGIRIKTHDVIIRGLRIRVGDNPIGPKPQNRDGIVIGNRDDAPHSIIIDHCSVSWAVDENISTWGRCHDITFQWCIISEGLRNSLHPKGAHSMGLLVGNDAINISIHHNLFVHNRDRNPKGSKNTKIEVINNFIYNWRACATRTPALANIIGNHYQAGVNHSGGMAVRNPTDDVNARFYLKDNIGPGRPIDVGSDWKITDMDSTKSGLRKPLFPLSNVTVNDVSEVLGKLANHSTGAGALIPRRDSVDIRIVKDVINEMGRIIDSQNEVGGWPNYLTGRPAEDNDRDGMPDEWEIRHGLHPQNRGDGNADRDGDGYTNIEEYINSFFESK